MLEWMTFLTTERICIQNFSLSSNFIQIAFDKSETSILSMHIHQEKEGFFLAYLWVITIGFIFCLGMVGGSLFFVLRSTLNPEDATKIDLNDSPKKLN